MTLYDGTNLSSGYTITYSKDGTNFTAENPTFKDVGNYPVYFKITAPNYFSVTGNDSVNI